MPIGRTKKKDNNQYGPERLVVVHGRYGFAALAFGRLSVHRTWWWRDCCLCARQMVERRIYLTRTAASRASAVRAALRAASSER